MKLWPIEKRVLAYLDQRGGKANRYDLVPDLSDPDSRIGRGNLNGSNAGIPRIMGAWCRRLAKGGLVREVRRIDGYYGHHEITEAGRSALRSD